MSSFRCEQCQVDLIDTPYGYVTSCRHFEADARPTPGQLMRFAGKEYGDSEEYGFTCRFLLASKGIGPALLPEEVLLLMLLVEAWRSYLADGGEV